MIRSAHSLILGLLFLTHIAIAAYAAHYITRALACEAALQRVMPKPTIHPLQEAEI